MLGCVRRCGAADSVALSFPGALLITTLAFVARGTWAVATGQRAKLSWVFLLYPALMLFILIITASAIAMSSNLGV
jgi:hypothetical protein